LSEPFAVPRNPQSRVCYLAGFDLALLKTQLEMDFSYFFKTSFRFSRRRILKARSETGAAFNLGRSSFRLAGASTSPR
jgi:hypothetical protein